MNTEDKYALKEFLTGVSNVVLILFIFITLLFLLNFFGNWATSLFISNEPSTEVVGKYKECDIVRWSSNNLAEYKYFLYCGENK
jgi:hypothetical protein